MEMAGNPLRGAVAARFGTCEAFAKKLGWSGRKARDIVSGRQTATAREIEQMAKTLDVWENPTAFMSIFFSNSVHIVD